MTHTCPTCTATTWHVALTGGIATYLCTCPPGCSPRTPLASLSSTDTQLQAELPLPVRTTRPSPPLAGTGPGPTSLVQRLPCPSSLNTHSYSGWQIPNSLRRLRPRAGPYRTWFMHGSPGVHPPPSLPVRGPPSQPPRARRGQCPHRHFPGLPSGSSQPPRARCQCPHRHMPCLPATPAPPCPWRGIAPHRSLPLAVPQAPGAPHSPRLRRC